MKHLTKGIICLCVLASLLLCVWNACIRNGKYVHLTYYVSAGGDDANDGLSPDRAWQSINRVNAHLFEPGDVILFRSGDTWKGQLRPQGSGVEGKPITIDRYGPGELPEIDQEDREGAVVQLENQEYWEITHLSVTASATKDDLEKDKPIVQGIRVIATTADHVLRHIVIRNCVVHHIYGRMKIFEGGGIWVGVPGWSIREGGKKGVENPYGYPPSTVTSFDGVWIENNKVSGVDRCGILAWTTAGPGSRSHFLPGLIPSKNVVVRGNELEDVGGDGILIMGSHAPLVEKNVARRCCKKAGHPALEEDGYWANCAATIWFHHCYKGVIQHNAVYDSEALSHNGDGMSYDFDNNCEQCTLQYNYSHNNRGGFLLLMGSATDNIARYNVSENDHTHILVFLCDVAANNQICNNVFYVTDTTYIIPRAHVRDNVFIAAGNAHIEIKDLPDKTTWRAQPWRPESGILLHNCYAGNCTVPPQDTSGYTTAPHDLNYYKSKYLK